MNTSDAHSICIIPARGGSKRIPRKNVQNFLGKPIIAYSIETALKSGLFHEVMVSTDDEEIAQIAKEYGASVPFLRSAKNSDDFATTYDVIEEVLREYEHNGFTFEYVCCIYACAPLVSGKLLTDAYSKLVLKSFDTVFPVIQFSFPIQRAIKLRDDTVQLVNNEYATTRSQDLEICYHDAGQFYWSEVSKLLSNSKLLTKNTGAIIIPEMEGQDIDTLQDWKLAELKFKLLNPGYSDTEG